MPTWGQLLNEIQLAIQSGNIRAYDSVRAKYISELANHTGRNTIIYASRWTTGDIPPHLTSINDEDIQAFMEAIHGIKGKELDLIIHTGGGSAEAADAIVTYLRQKFEHIRIVIPQVAMSAGTMLACSADEIIMGKHSFIGPIDPQFILNTQIGTQAVPAQAILDQFNMAQEDCRNNPLNLNTWMPMLGQYGPALIVQCKNQIDFGRDLVCNWLKAYMFKEQNGNEAERISKYLSDHRNFKTHGKHISIVDAKDIGLKIIELENDQTLQEKVLSAFHATMLTLNTNAIKIICNQNGNAFIKQIPMPLNPIQIQKRSLGSPISRPKV